MNELHAKILARVFEWAWRNHINVRLDRYVISGFGHGPAGEHPNLTFDNGQKQRSIRFQSFDEIGPRLTYEWKQITVDLCTEPLNLDDLE